MIPDQAIQWRATGPYTAGSTATAGLLNDTREFLHVYAGLTGTVAERSERARGLLVRERLAQRSRATRATVAQRIHERLTRWNPPEWVLDDLVRFADSPDALKAALLLHVARQDVLLYAVVQKLVVQRWNEGERQIQTADVQGFLDQELSIHPEIAQWTTSTRARLATNTLSTLRDYGLLQGKHPKLIAQPIVPDAVARHLERLLIAEGFTGQELPHHPDWRVWLWTSERASRFLQSQAATVVRQGNP